MNSTPPRPIRLRLPRTPNGDHPELFIPKKISSPSKRGVTPSKLKNQFQGLYQPAEIHSQAKELSTAVSRAMNESDKSMKARLDARSSEITSAFSKAVELVMWKDKPTKTTVTTRKKLRERVANKLGLPEDCFDSGPWSQMSRDIIETEVRKQNSRSAVRKSEWKKNKYNVYQSFSQASPKQKRVLKESPPTAIAIKRPRKESTAAQLLKQYAASMSTADSGTTQIPKTDESTQSVPTLPSNSFPTVGAKRSRRGSDPFKQRNSIPSRKK